MRDYFVYLPDRSAGSIWGAAATSVGFARVAPNRPYPPHRHPVDHHFTWSKGRVLQGYQIVFISEGRGVFESARGPHSQPVEAGTVLLLFPGVWHRYAPVPKTGWVEHWIECRGRVFDEACARGLLEPERAVLSPPSPRGLLACFQRCHALARHGALGNQDALSTLGLHLLSILCQHPRGERAVAQRQDAVVERAHSLIAMRCHETINLHTLAAELGVSYSHFRHAFKARLGVSPKQCQLQLRLAKAQDLLANTAKTAKEIADILGFESAFHLSKQFKERVGLSPTHWREINVSGGGKNAVPPRPPP